MIDNYTRAAELKRIVDGDTCVLFVNCGFKIGVTIKARLSGINCPELRTPEGQAAKAFAADWFVKAGNLSIVSHGEDKFGGRWDCTVYGEDGTTLNAALLLSGNAVAMKG